VAIGFLYTVSYGLQMIPDVPEPDDYERYIARERERTTFNCFTTVRFSLVGHLVVRLIVRLM